MLCRLCLKNNETLHNIITSETKCAELTLIESLYWIFGVEVDVNDPYSKFICSRCENVVQYVGSYRALYRRNQLILEGKLNSHYQYDELVDEMLLKASERNGQFKDTVTKHTSDDSVLSPKAKRRRLELIKYYYEAPTTAIRELIGYQHLKDTKNDDRSLFQVNEIVNVEVCKYCSEIFTTKRLLDFHYKTKHKSAEKKVLRFKRHKKKRKHIFSRYYKKQKNIFHKAETSKQLLNRYSSLNKLLERDNRPKNFLFDVEKFPNLNFVKQLDTCAKEKAALEITDKSENANLLDQSSNGCQDNEEEDYVDVETIDNGSNNENSKVKTTGEITIEAANDPLLKSNHNEENMIQYRWLNLKDFFISLERCAVPREFYESNQTVAEKMNSNTNISEKELNVLPRTEGPRNTVNIAGIKQMKDHISSIWKKNETANENNIYRSSIKNITLESENSNGRALDCESTDGLVNCRTNCYESNEVMDIISSDDETDVQTSDNCSKQKIGSGLMMSNINDDYLSKNNENGGIDNQYQSLIMRNLYVSIQKCDIQSEFEQSVILETNNSVNKFRKMRHWKDHISETLFKLRHIKSDEDKVNTNIDIDFANTSKGSSETIVPTSLKSMTPTPNIDIDFANTSKGSSETIVPTSLKNMTPAPEDGNNDQIQSIKLSDNCILENDIRNQYKQLNLKDFYISIRRCQIPKDSYQNNEILNQKKNNLQRKEELNNINEINKTPQKSQIWKTNLFESLFKIKEINNQFKDVKHTKYDVRNLNQNEHISSVNESRRIDNKEQPVKKNFVETPRKEVSRVHINQIKSVSSENKLKRKRQRKNNDVTHIRSLNRTDSLPSMLEVAVVIPKIDIFLKKLGYNVNRICEPVDISRGSEELENSRQKTYPPDSHVFPTVSNCMPRLEKETDCKKDSMQDVPDEPPKLEPQVHKSEAVKTVNTLGQVSKKTLYSRKSKNSFVRRNKKRKLKFSTKPINKGVITNIVNTEGSSINLERKPCKLKRKVQVSTVTTEEVEYTGMEQLTNLLNSMEIKDNSDINWVNGRFNLFEELPINDWKEKIFRKYNGQSLEEEFLLNENEANSLINEKSVGVNDDSNNIKQKSATDYQNSKPCEEVNGLENIPNDDHNKIGETNAPNYLNKKGKGGKVFKLPEKIMKNDTHLVIEEVGDIPEENYATHPSKEIKENNYCAPSEKGIIENDASIIAKDIEGIPDDNNKIAQNKAPYYLNNEKNDKNYEPSQIRSIEDNSSLVAKEIEDITEDDINKIEWINALCHLDKERKEDSECSEKGIKNDTSLIAKEIEGIPEDDNKIKKKADQHHLDKKQNNCVSGANNIGEEKVMRSWKNQISDVLFKLKHIQDDDISEHEYSESDLNTPETCSLSNATEVAKNITEIDKNYAKILDTSLLNVEEQSVSVANAVIDSQHKNVVEHVERPIEGNDTLEISSITNSCTESTEALQMNIPSSALDQNKTYKIPIDDFGNEKKDARNIKSLIQSRWTNITKGNASIVSNISLPSSSSVDLQTFAHSIVKETSEK